MALIPIIIGFLQILFFAAGGVALVYLISKRLEDKKHEKFEKRDN